MKVESWTGGQKEKFRQASNKLLNQIFILKKKDDTKNDYYFIRQNLPIFTEYFDFLGYSVNLNEDLGIVMLENTFGTGRLALNKINSILLLILRLLYIEKRKDLNVSSDEVVVTIEEMRTKVRLLELNNKKLLSMETEKAAFAIFRRYNLIKTLDTDFSDSGMRIIIYPSILLSLTNENITSVYETTQERLKDYTQGQDDDQENID